MSADAFDYSAESFTAVLGADVMQQIRASVAAAPAPKPEQVERLRTIFAPAVAELTAVEEAQAA